MTQNLLIGRWLPISSFEQSQPTKNTKRKTRARAKKMTMMTKATTATRSERALIYFGGYHPAKWAVGGLIESLARAVAPFGVKVCALEPGGMLTNWWARANKDTPDLLPDYEPSVGAVVKALGFSQG